MRRQQVFIAFTITVIWYLIQQMWIAVVIAGENLRIMFE